MGDFKFISSFDLSVEAHFSMTKCIAFVMSKKRETNTSLHDGIVLDFYFCVFRNF